MMAGVAGEIQKLVLRVKSTIKWFFRNKDGVRTNVVVRLWRKPIGSILGPLNLFVCLSATRQAVGNWLDGALNHSLAVHKTLISWFPGRVLAVVLTCYVWG